MISVSRGLRAFRALAAAMAAGLVLVVSGASVPAFAHTSLVVSSPAVEAEMAAPVTAVWLEFETQLVEDLSRIAVTGPDGSNLVEGQPTVSGSVVTVQVPPMAELGNYRVSYRVVSLDGHLVEGDYGFSITAGAQSVAGASRAPTAAAGGGARAGIGESTLWWGALWVALLVVAGTAVAAQRAERLDRDRDVVRDHS